MKRKPSLETRYRKLRQDARVMAEMLDLAAQRLDLAAQRLEQLARRHEPDKVIATSVNCEYTYTASDVHELASECTEVAYERGRGRGRKQP